VSAASRAALEGVIVREGLLHWMERSVRTRQPFDCADLMSLGRYGERKAGKDPHPVNVNRAGTALAVVTAFL
jgi:hypothetical protein